MEISGVTPLAFITSVPVPLERDTKPYDLCPPQYLAGVVSPLGAGFGDPSWTPLGSLGFHSRGVVLWTLGDAEFTRNVPL